MKRPVQAEFERDEVYAAASNLAYTAFLDDSRGLNPSSCI